MILKSALSFLKPNISFIGAAIGVGLLAVGISFFLGYSKAAREGRDSLALYQLSVKAVGEAREAQTRQVIVSQQQIATEANDEATKLRAALAEHYRNSRVRVPKTDNTRSGDLPSVSCFTGSVEPAAAESELSTLRLKAADDALTILLLQKWAAENAALRP